MPIVTEKSRKWIITIFMSALIVAFILPSYFGQGGHNRRDIPVATAYGENISELEMENAKREWEMLQRAELSPGTGAPLTLRLFTPADLLLLRGLDPTLFQMSVNVASTLNAAISNDPKLYALLKREAAHRNIRASEERLRDLLTENINLPDSTPPELKNQWIQAAQNFLAVEASIQQSALAIKTSRPVIQSVIATQRQMLSLNVVLFDANEFRAKVAPPSDSAVEALYTANRDKLPNAQINGDEAFSPTNYGFGYRLNDGVRLEYIALNRNELARAAKASKTAHEWDVEGNRYYLQNRSKFVRLPAPTTSPTSQPASTQPVQQTYEQVRGEILAQLQETRTGQLQSQVEKLLVQLLSSDYRQYTDAKLKGAAAPATSVGVPVGSADYLRAVASRVEKETGVLPEVTAFGDRYLDASAFEREEIGRTTLAEARSARPMTLGAYVLSRAKPFFEANSAARREPGAAALEVLEPTPVFTAGEFGSRPVVIARLLDARPATTLPLERVRDQVREDAIQQAATEAARTAADAFLASIGSSSSLKAAATAAGRTVIAAPSLSADPSSVPPEMFTFSQVSKDAFKRAAFDLLRGDPKPGQSRAIVSLPRDRKVAVIELQGVQPLDRGSEAAELELNMQFANRLAAVNSFLFAYLQPDAILARTQFVDLTGRTKPAATQPETAKN